MNATIPLPVLLEAIECLKLARNLPGPIEQYNRLLNAGINLQAHVALLDISVEVTA